MSHRSFLDLSLLFRKDTTDLGDLAAMIALFLRRIRGVHAMSYRSKAEIRIGQQQPRTEIRSSRQEDELVTLCVCLDVCMFVCK